MFFLKRTSILPDLASYPRERGYEATVRDTFISTCIYNSMAEVSLFCILGLLMNGLVMVVISLM